MARWTRRPIDQWPGDLTADRARSPFTAPWNQTMKLLDRELDHLSASNVVLMEAYGENDYRLDGDVKLRATRKHPGVILAFDSRFGALKYACDRFIDWQSNVRAIALGLEALRKVDRYGITNRGEQYTGWKSLGSGIEMGAAGSTMTHDEALEYLRIGANWRSGPDWDHEGQIRDAYRVAAKRMHPDAGGRTSDFQRLQIARDICLEKLP